MSEVKFEKINLYEDEYRIIEEILAQNRMILEMIVGMGDPRKLIMGHGITKEELMEKWRTSSR